MACWQFLTHPQLQTSMAGEYLSSPSSSSGGRYHSVITLLVYGRLQGKKRQRTSTLRSIHTSRAPPCVQTEIFQLQSLQGLWLHLLENDTSKIRNSCSNIIIDTGYNRSLQIQSLKRHVLQLSAPTNVNEMAESTCHHILQRRLMNHSFDSCMSEQCCILTVQDSSLLGSPFLRIVKSSQPKVCQLDVSSANRNINIWH